jgi:hypothetical protein
MKRTLPIASQLAAVASTLPPTSDNMMTIPSDTFMTVLLLLAYTRSTLYLRKTLVGSVGTSIASGLPTGHNPNNPLQMKAVQGANAISVNKFKKLAEAQAIGRIMFRK